MQTIATTRKHETGAPESLFDIVDNEAQTSVSKVEQNYNWYRMYY